MTIRLLGGREACRRMAGTEIGLRPPAGVVAGMNETVDDDQPLRSTSILYSCTQLYVARLNDVVVRSTTTCFSPTVVLFRHVHSHRGFESNNHHRSKRGRDTMPALHEPYMSEQLHDFVRRETLGERLTPNPTQVCPGCWNVSSRIGR